MRRLSMTRARRAALVLGLVGALAGALSVPAQAADRKPQAMSSVVYDALIGRGYTDAEATAIASDPDQAKNVPVSVSFEETSGNTKPIKTTGPVAAFIGDCSGSGRWVERTQYINNQFGNHIAHVKLRTNWSYNGSRVTCAGSSRSWYIYSWVVGVTWQGWQDFYEYFYTSGGRASGGALTYTQGKFGLCLPKCVSSNWPWVETRVYYNGTSLTSSGTIVTYP
jgi:hypothetical protein